MSTHTTGTRDERGLADLLKDLRDETTTLLRQEVALAKTEISEKGSRVGRNVASLAVGGLVAYAGLMFILLAASYGIDSALRAAGLDADITRWLGPLAVGVVVAIIGYTMVQKAISTLKRESIVPEQTVASVKENTQWVKQRAK